MIFWKKEYTAAGTDHRLPFPGRQALEEGPGLTLKLPMVKMDYTRFNRRSSVRSRLGGDRLIEISFKDTDQPIYLTVDLMPLVYRISVRRMLSFIELLLDKQVGDMDHNILSRLDFLLKDKYHSNVPEHQLTMSQLFRSLGPPGNEFNDNFEIWATIAHKLILETIYSEKPALKRIVMIQAFSLVFAWLSFEYDLTRQKQDGARLLVSIYKHITSFKRYMPKNEIFAREDVKAYVTKFSRQAFVDIWEDFLKNYSVWNPDGDMSKAVVTLEEEVIGEYYVHFSHLLNTFQNDLNKARHKKTGIKQIRYVLRWGDMLYSDHYDEDVEKAMTNDTAFFKDLDATIAKQYPVMFGLYAFFSKRPDVLLYLIKESLIPDSAYFTADGKIKTLSSLLHISRQEILKKARKAVPWWQKLMISIARLFKGGKNSESLWNAVHQEEQRLENLARKQVKKTPPVKKKPVQAPVKKKVVKTIDKRGEKPAAPREPVEERDVQDINARKNRELYKKFSKGKTKEFYTRLWKTSPKISNDRARIYVDRIIGDRISFVLNYINTGNIEEIASHIAADPRLSEIIDKDALTIYIKLSILEHLKDK